MTNYLAYSDLDFDEIQLFCAAKLDQYLKEAHSVLFKAKPVVTYYQYGSFSGNLQKEAAVINPMIDYVLELIGKYSNERFGKTAAQQHTFFSRLKEQPTFFLHLFLAIREYKQTVILPGKRKAKKQFTASTFDESHLVLKQHEPKGFFFDVNGQRLTEKQLYAAGVYYYANFLYIAVRKRKTLHLCELFANLVHFQSGISYSRVHGAMGGLKSANKRNAKREKAYTLFKEKKMLETYGPKIEAMVNPFQQILRRNGITISEPTLKTKWLPEFRQKTLQEIDNKY